MTINRLWGLSLALVGGAMVGAAFTLQRRKQRRHGANRLHKESLHEWEAEGGSLPTPATARLPA